MHLFTSVPSQTFDRCTHSVPTGGPVNWNALLSVMHTRFLSKSSFWWNIVIIRRRSLHTGMTWCFVFLNISVFSSATQISKRCKRFWSQCSYPPNTHTPPPSYPLLVIPLGINLASLTKPRTLVLFHVKRNLAHVCSSHGFHLWSAKSEIMLYHLEWQLAHFFFFICAWTIKAYTCLCWSKRTFQIMQLLRMLCSRTMQRIQLNEGTWFLPFSNMKCIYLV